MNLNLRYVTIRDAGNKSWLVRAPYVVNHIAETEPLRRQRPFVSDTVMMP